MNKNEIDETLEELEKMSDNVLVLNDAYSKENPLLLELANITYYLLWNYTKSLIALKMYLNSTFRCEKDFALSQICITINECLKHVIGFNTKDSKQRKDSIWIAKMGRFIVSHPEMQEHYNSLKEKLGETLFKKIFEVILTDNGWEFSEPADIEFNYKTGGVRGI